MGISQSSSTIRVLVVGLTGSGKTHFLDLLSEECAAGRPTIGYHEVTYTYEGCRFIFTEYGGSVDWEKLIQMDTGPPFDCMYMIVREENGTFSSANNALLMMASLLPINVPIAVVWNVEILRTQNFHYPRNRRICSVTLNYQVVEECLEKIYRLLRWTSAQSSTV